MKKILSLLISALLVLTACNSSKKNLERGNYDEIISKSVKKLIKNPDSSKDAVLLDKAYKLANDRDLDAIKFLKLEGQPDNWDKILKHYAALKARQNSLKPVLPFKLNGQLTNYKQIDYDAEIVNAKRKAAAYFYANGKRLLESGDKQFIRGAYAEFIKAKSYMPSQYPDLENLIAQARYMGISRVVVEIQNESQYNFPKEFMKQILSGSAANLNSQWVQYYFSDTDEQIDFDYAAVVKFLNVQVSPDEIKNEDHVFKKKVEDGFEYVLDARGNVKKDTAGNDIKKLKYKEIQCALVKTIQHKEAILNGEVEFYDLHPHEQLIAKKPFGATSVFHHVSARAIGDEAALDADARQMIKMKKVPFPMDEELIFGNATQVQEAVWRLLRDNQGLFQ